MHTDIGGTDHHGASTMERLSNINLLYFSNTDQLDHTKLYVVHLATYLYTLHFCTYITIHSSDQYILKKLNCIIL